MLIRRIVIIYVLLLFSRAVTMPKRHRGGSIAGAVGAAKKLYAIGKKIAAAHDFVKTNRYVSRGLKGLASIPGNPYAEKLGDYAARAELKGYGKRRRHRGGGASVAHGGRMVVI